MSVAKHQKKKKRKVNGAICNEGNALQANGFYLSNMSTEFTLTFQSV